MGAFIGPLGGLIELMHHEEAQSIEQGAEPTFFVGLDGAKTAFVQPSAGLVLRGWKVSQGSARPEQAAAFHALCLGAYGPGPFVFVDPLAQWNNVLSPRQSLMEPGLLASAGPRSNIAPAVMPLPGQGAVPAGVVTSKSTAFWGWYTPILRDRPVTLSLLVQGQAEVTLRIMRNDATWTNRHTVTKTITTSPGVPERVSLTFDQAYAADAEMCGVQVKTTSSALIAQPQITWTAQPIPWSVGRGAPQVVVSGFSESYERTGRPDGRRRISYGATVTEVGNGA